MYDESQIAIPDGFQLTGVHCGIKEDPGNEDLTLVLSSIPAVAVGVYTQNVVFAAPVELDRERTPTPDARVIVVNSGNANACTGEHGRNDAHRMAALAASACGVDEPQVLVLSTGVIGELLPMDKISSGISSAADQLANDDFSLRAAARGMMTTDKVHKLAGRQATLGGRDIRIMGMAKGSGMIAPNMATMLAVVLTDAELLVEDAQRILSAVVETTFNCISVDGHTSTNDTVLMLANGAAAPEPLSGGAVDEFQRLLAEICTELARDIIGDAEGASHRITIDVNGCRTWDEARKIAKAVANSPLVKTAVAGADPNWGRIVSAAGNSGVAFDPQRVDLFINDTLIYKQGAPTEFDPGALSSAIRASRETSLKFEFQEGTEGTRFWTSDLTADYVRFNADYHT